MILSLLVAVLSSYITARWIRAQKGYLKMALVLNDSQKVTFTLTVFTAKGKPAKIDGAPEWSVSDPSVLEVIPSVDRMSATVNALSDGDAQVVVKADADLGSGVRELTATADISVISEATALTLTAGIPDPK